MFDRYISNDKLNEFFDYQEKYIGSNSKQFILEEICNFIEKFADFINLLVYV